MMLGRRGAAAERTPAEAPPRRVRSNSLRLVIRAGYSGGMGAGLRGAARTLSQGWTLARAAQFS